MTEPTAAARYEADDARLLNMVRAGDSEAFDILRERHEVAARRLARSPKLAGDFADGPVVEDSRARFHHCFAHGAARILFRGFDRFKAAEFHRL